MGVPGLCVGGGEGSAFQHVWARVPTHYVGTLPCLRSGLHHLFMHPSTQCMCAPPIGTRSCSLAKTTDAGVTWSLLNTPISGSGNPALKSICSPDGGTHIWAMGAWNGEVAGEFGGGRRGRCSAPVHHVRGGGSITATILLQRSCAAHPAHVDASGAYFF